MPPLPAWLLFLLSAVAVILAGARLSRDGDTLAERTGLGGAWIGAILVAGATSLPELATGVYGVRAGEVNLAVGDIFGSCMANLLILAVADLSTRHVSVLTRVTANQVLVAGLGICLLATAIAGILTPVRFTVLGIGWAPAVIGVSYVMGMRLLHVNRGQPAFETAAEAAVHRKQLPPMRTAVLGFVVAAAVILFAARFLAASAEQLAHQLGLTTGFVGMVLLAVTTSLPEVSVSVASVRQGSYDLAVGNLLGSNCFNCSILFVHDLVDGPGSLLARVQPSLVLAAVFGVLLTGQTVLAVLNRSERRIWLLEPDALLLLLTYGLGLWFVYQAGG